MKLKSEICATLNCSGYIYPHFFYIYFYYNNLFLKFFIDLKNIIRSKRASGTSLSHFWDISVAPATIR